METAGPIRRSALLPCPVHGGSHHHANAETKTQASDDNWDRGSADVGSQALDHRSSRTTDTESGEQPSDDGSPSASQSPLFITGHNSS